MKSIRAGLATGTALLVPAFAFAQTGVAIGATILTVIDSIVIPLFFTLALGTFTYGITQYYVQGNHDDEIRQKSVALLVYGLVALVVMALLWAGVHYAAGSLGF